MLPIFRHIGRNNIQRLFLCIRHRFHNEVGAVYFFLNQNSLGMNLFSLCILVSVRTGRTTILNRIVIVNYILNSGNVIHVAHTVVCFSLFSVTLKDVFYSSLIQFCFIAANINSRNLLNVTGRSFSYVIQLIVWHFLPGIVFNRLHIFHQIIVHRILICFDNLLLFRRMRCRVCVDNCAILRLVDLCRSAPGSFCHCIGNHLFLAYLRCFLCCGCLLRLYTVSGICLCLHVSCNVTGKVYHSGLSCTGDHGHSIGLFGLFPNLPPCFPACLFVAHATCNHFADLLIYCGLVAQNSRFRSNTGKQVHFLTQRFHTESLPQELLDFLRFGAALEEFQHFAVAEFLGYILKTRIRKRHQCSLSGVCTLCAVLLQSVTKSSACGNCSGHSSTTAGNGNSCQIVQYAHAALIADCGKISKHTGSVALDFCRCFLQYGTAVNAGNSANIVGVQCGILACSVCHFLCVFNGCSHRTGNICADSGNVAQNGVGILCRLSGVLCQLLAAAPFQSFCHLPHLGITILFYDGIQVIIIKCRLRENVVLIGSTLCNVAIQIVSVFLAPAFQFLQVLFCGRLNFRSVLLCLVVVCLGF